MNKTDLLFRMMEHPQDYTDNQWQEILSDKECYELYVLMAKTQMAFVQETIDEETIETEWRRFERKHLRKATFRQWWVRVAAVFLGVLMLSGIAFAVIRTIVQKSHVAQCKRIVGGGKESSTEQTTTPAKSETQTVVFDNMPLEKIVCEIAAFYHVDADVQNEQAGRLRFYFVWKQKDSLQMVVGQLNQFGRVNIVMAEGKLMVK